MKNPTSSLLLLVFLLIFACLCEIIVKADEADDSKVYIIYLGHKPHDDHELITDSHHDILSQVAGSKEEAKKLMMYSYRHGFSGFAAKLTNSQAKQIGGISGESEAFNDNGMGPIPSRWKGICKSEANFNATIHSVDASGHGSHCASTAAGSYVNNLQYYGLNMGTIRGGAPLARLAIYKASRPPLFGVGTHDTGFHDKLSWSMSVKRLLPIM
ncbi:hypothetical protein KY285_004820 [Solanum tuberosum]|nr:hypothetical protein KY289_005251 [Solanum tuberosum]KAH0751672.1 hypothetical protein KY285_004820 [Solanum tuberosum]